MTRQVLLGSIVVLLAYAASGCCSYEDKHVRRIAELNVTATEMKNDADLTKGNAKKAAKALELALESLKSTVIKGESFDETDIPLLKEDMEGVHNACSELVLYLKEPPQNDLEAKNLVAIATRGMSVAGSCGACVSKNAEIRVLVLTGMKLAIAVLSILKPLAVTADADPTLWSLANPPETLALEKSGDSRKALVKVMRDHAERLAKWNEWAEGLRAVKDAATILAKVDVSAENKQKEIQRLFVERASQINPDWAKSAEKENIEAIAGLIGSFAVEVDKIYHDDLEKVMGSDATEVVSALIDGFVEALKLLDSTFKDRTFEVARKLK